jgi:hypothetical protein
LPKLDHSISKAPSLVSNYEAWEKKVGAFDWEFFLKCGGFYVG